MLSRLPQSFFTASGNEYTDQVLEVTAGAVPKDIHGHMFFVGPVGSVASGHTLPRPNGTTVLNSDAMVYRVDLDQAARGGPVRLSSRIAKTPDFYADQAAQPDGSAYATLRFQDTGLVRFGPLGLRNHIGTALLPIFKAGALPRMLLTFDAGRPYEIDTKSLEVVTPVGANAEWEPALPTQFGIFDYPFPMNLATAHPCWDGDTQEFIGVNFGRSLSNILIMSLPVFGTLAATSVAAQQIMETILQPLEAALSMSNNVSRWSRGRLLSAAPSRATKENPGHDFVTIHVWDGTGAIRCYPVQVDGKPPFIHQSIHQVGLTKNWVVLNDSAFKIGVESLLNRPFPNHPWVERFVRASLTRPQIPVSIFYFIRRADLQGGSNTVAAKVVRLPLETDHFLVDYDDQGGDKVKIYACHNTSTDVAEWNRPFDISPDGNPVPDQVKGMVTLGQVDVNHLGCYVVDPAQEKVVVSGVYTSVEDTAQIGLYAYRDVVLPGETPPEHLNTIYWVDAGIWPELSSRFVDTLYKYHMNRWLPIGDLNRLRDAGGRPSSIIAFHYPTMTVLDRYDFPLKAVGEAPLSFQFVPRLRVGPPPADPDRDGYLVGTVCTDRGGEIWIFDAADLKRGPVCKLAVPAQPLTYCFSLHTAWVPKIGLRQATYNVPVRVDYESAYRAASPLVQQLFNQEIFPHYP
jgi:carotenoid cleavage dioxygenase-like enzyme